jgi:hypothetical protein
MRLTVHVFLWQPLVSMPFSLVVAFHKSSNSLPYWEARGQRSMGRGQGRGHAHCMPVRAQHSNACLGLHWLDLSHAHFQNPHRYGWLYTFYGLSMTGKFGHLLEMSSIFALNVLLCK